MKERNTNRALIAGSIAGIIVLMFPILYILGDGNLKMAILLMLAQSATALEMMIGLIGITLMFTALLIYGAEQDKFQAHISKQLDDIKSEIVQWVDQFGWFTYYLSKVEVLQTQTSNLISLCLKEEESRSTVSDLKRKTEVYASILQEVREKVDSLNDLLQRIGPSLQAKLERDYEKDRTIALGLATVGLAMLLFAVIMPGTDSLLGLVAEQMVDPSLHGEERLREIFRIKDMLKSL